MMYRHEGINDMEQSVNKNVDEEYSVQELLDELARDDSWEADPRARFMAVMLLKSKLEKA